MSTLELRTETQQDQVADEVSALIAVVRPILEGLLYSTKGDRIKEAGGYDGVTLHMLAAIHADHHGDVGICFEHAVHDAIARREEGVIDRFVTSMGLCAVGGEEPASILFAAEKQGSMQLIDTAEASLTNDSVLMYGTRGRPVKLRRHVRSLADSFRRKGPLPELPQSISGLWRSDLFVGWADTDRWVGTSVKVNGKQLKGERGLRVGFIPAPSGRDDRPFKDDNLNLVVCPLPYDGEFVQVFFEGMRIVRQVMAAYAEMPSEPALPLPVERLVAKELVDRRKHRVVEILDVLRAQAQPGLLESADREASVIVRRGHVETETVVAPIAMRLFEP